MRNIITLLIVGTVFLFSCKDNNKSAGTTGTSDTTLKADSNKNKAYDEPEGNDVKEANKEIANLVDPLKLIKIDDLEKIMKSKFENTKIKCTKSGKFSRSCFIKWEDGKNGTIKNMFIMLQTSPIPDEFEDWAHSFIEAKIKTGDMSYPNTDAPYIYKPIKNMDIESAYNKELNRVYWKYNKDYVFAIFYNIHESDKAQIEYAKKIAELMNKNFKKVISQ